MGLMADILNERKLVVKSGREEVRMKQEARSNRMENQSQIWCDRASTRATLTRLEFPFLPSPFREKKVAARCQIPERFSKISRKKFFLQKFPTASKDPP